MLCKFSGVALPGPARHRQCGGIARVVRGVPALGGSRRRHVDRGRYRDADLDRDWRPDVFGQHHRIRKAARTDVGQADSLPRHAAGDQRGARRHRGVRWMAGDCSSTSDRAILRGRSAWAVARRRRLAHDGRPWLGRVFFEPQLAAQWIAIRPIFASRAFINDGHWLFAVFIALGE